MVIPILCSLVIWVIGFIIIISERLLVKQLKNMHKKLNKHAEATRFNDNSASLAYSIGGAALDMIPWFYIRTLCIVIGMIVFALGWVPLGFIAV